MRLYVCVCVCERERERERERIRSVYVGGKEKRDVDDFCRNC